MKHFNILIIFFSLSFAFGQIAFTASDIATSANGALSVFAADMDGVIDILDIVLLINLILSS